MLITDGERGVADAFRLFPLDTVPPVSKYCIYTIYALWPGAEVVIVLIVLDHASGTPLYQQIVEQVRAMILTGKLKPGEPMPSIRQLASELVISVITTTRAYQELEAVGLISAQPGRGTFVADVSATARTRLIQAEVAAKLDHAVRQADQVGMELDELHQLLDRQWRQRPKGRLR